MTKKTMRVSATQLETKLRAGMIAKAAVGSTHTQCERVLLLPLKKLSRTTTS